MAVGIVGVLLAIGIWALTTVYLRSNPQSELVSKSPISASAWSDQGRTDFVGKATEDCFSKQRALWDNRNLSDTQLKSLCGCSANSAADQMTNEEVRLNNRGTPSPSAISKMTASFEKCRQASTN